MRAAEFMRALADIIDKLDGESSDQPAKHPEEKDDNPTMIPPLQQQLELQKAEQGKDSPVIQDLTQDEQETDDYAPAGVGSPQTVIQRKQ